MTVDLEGTTFISKKGITTSTFKAVPDVPVTSFELVLPKGPHSALAANGNLCKGSLTATNRIPRAKRRADQADHEDQRHGLPEEEDKTKNEGQEEEAKKHKAEGAEGNSRARGTSNASERNC